ncbi:MAG: sodium:solute symporter family protein [bacterium]
MKLNLSTNDYLIIIAYFVAVLVIGFKTKTSDNSVKDYIIAGRTLTLPAFVATLVSSFYGGVLGIGEFTYSFGISGWLLYAFPFYFFITIFALFLADKVRKAHLYTIPDKLNRIYGKKVSIFGAILIFFLTTPAPYLFMMAILMKLIFGFNILYAMIVSLALSILYLLKGGLRADVRVNIFEFILMFVGFGIILPFCFNILGGYEFLEARLPPQHLSITGGFTIQYFFVWFFIGAWALIDPVFYQRCYAVKNKKTPKIGVLISLFFWFIFDAMTTITGLYSKAYFGNDLTEPLYSFPALGEKILPPIAKSVFLVGMIATIMSSLHSYIFVSSTTFSRDILGRIKNIDDDKFLYRGTGLLVSAVFALLIAKLIPSVVEIWYTVGTIIIPALLISVVTSYYPKLHVHSKYIFAAMIASSSVSLLCFLTGQILSLNGTPRYPLGIEPMYPGLVIGLIIYFIGYSKRKYLVVESDY